MSVVPGTLALDLEGMPDLSPAAQACLVVALLLLWLSLRVYLLRRHRAELGAEAGEEPGPRWLVALSRSPAALPLLLTGLVAAATLAFLAAR